MCMKVIGFRTRIQTYGGCDIMFKPLFESMHEVLDDIMKEYPASSGNRKHELEEQLRSLKAISDSYIEEWLQFEEKMSLVTSQMQNEDSSDWMHHGLSSETFRRGQGYYKLFMFEQAIKEFEKLVAEYGDFLIARMYLAMGYLQKGELDEASRHFHLIVPLTENRKFLAIAYNALGCVHAKKGNHEQACEYFQKAMDLDPTYQDPSINMEICGEDNERLRFGITML